MDLVAGYLQKLEEKIRQRSIDQTIGHSIKNNRGAKNRNRKFKETGSGVEDCQIRRIKSGDG
jgi:hypothetical protein